MASLFKRTPLGKIKLAGVDLDLPGITTIAAPDPKTAGPLWERIDDELGVTLEELQEELAALARTNYPAYIEYKTSQIKAARDKTRLMMAQLAGEFRRIGYTEDEAIKAARPAAKSYYDSFLSVFKKIFPDQGKKVVETY